MAGPFSTTWMDDGAVALLERAKGYPYETPSACSVLAGGGVLPLVAIDLTSTLDCEVDDGGTVRSLRAWAERRGVQTDGIERPQPLLAYGSNASIEALSRKLAQCLDDAVVPVARATLADFDVVYSAHLTSYGSVPATLQHSPGAESTVWVLVTTPAQCLALRGTEPNYHFAELSGLDLRLDLGPTLTDVAAVVSRHGALTLGGRDVGLAAVDVRARRFPAMTQGQVLRAVRDLVAPAVDLDAFIVENVHDPGLARRRTAVLRRTARPFDYPSWRVVEPAPSALEQAELLDDAGQ